MNNSFKEEQMKELKERMDEITNQAMRKEITETSFYKAIVRICKGHAYDNEIPKEKYKEFEKYLSTKISGTYIPGGAEGIFIINSKMEEFSKQYKYEQEFSMVVADEK